MLRKAGYYTAYKGKWHLNKEFDTHEPEKLFTKEMDAYGFSDLRRARATSSPTRLAATSSIT